MGMMNVGAPRIGNRRFIRSYNSTVCPSFRVVNDRDTVPTIPHLYFHVNTEIEVNPDGKLLIGDELLQKGMDRREFREYIVKTLLNTNLKAELLCVRLKKTTERRI